ncbi:MAG: endonuclease Q family protein [Nanoarchaeota archaeon]|nr:endonuclease Q family protein [Nanoarchaeota archaeon]
MNFNDIIFADLHIHSRFSRACSKNIDFENLVKWARIKGLNLLGTGDFTHPIWIKEIQEKLIEKNGFYYYNDFPFIITGEISLIYSQMNEEDSKNGRRVHLVLLVPNIEIAEKINSYLDTKGRRDYDGRPIFKISCKDFTRDMMNISKEIEIIPAHAWTPWFGVFGSMSGFDSLKEAFGEELENIHAIETGMSSDPEMNWRINELHNKAIVSFSDSHSFWPFRLGREATIFKKTDSYNGIIEQIRNNDFVATIETEPAYGKYHFDGHRDCNFSCSPEKTKEINGICPVCNKPLVIGVAYRVEQLANNPEGFKLENGKPFFRLLPLQEVIAFAIGSTAEGKKTWAIYNSLIENFGNEFNILLNVPKEKFLEKSFDEKLADLIIKNREEKIIVKPGYDGVYGEAVLGEKQESLF